MISVGTDAAGSHTGDSGKAVGQPAIAATLSISVRERLLTAVREAATVLLPGACAGCGVLGPALCERCRAGMSSASQRLEAPLLGVPVVAAFDYLGTVRRVLLAYKEHGRTSLARALAPALRAAAAAALVGVPTATAPLVAVCVPDSAAALRRRGWRPVPLLARRAKLRTLGALRVARPVHDQAGLSREERQHNVYGAFAARMPLAGTRVLILDDVLTTGATIAETVRAVRAAGGEPVAAAVLARVPLRSTANYFDITMG